MFFCVLGKAFELKISLNECLDKHNRFSVITHHQTTQIIETVYGFCMIYSKPAHLINQQKFRPLSSSPPQKLNFRRPVAIKAVLAPISG